jgi:ribonuclease P protein subunit RPR2
VTSNLLGYSLEVVVMGKKGKTKGDPSSGHSSDMFKRMNFLYQASHWMLLSSGNPNLSRFYNHNLQRLSTRNVIRMTPNVKRKICKRCHTLLIPSISATIRVKPRRENHLVITCDYCGCFRRFITPKISTSPPEEATASTLSTEILFEEMKAVDELQNSVASCPPS